MSRQYRDECVRKIRRYHALGQKLHRSRGQTITREEQIEYQELSHALAPLDVIGILLDELSINAIDEGVNNGKSDPVREPADPRPDSNDADRPAAE